MSGKKGGRRVEDSSGETGDSGGQAVTLDGETVDSGSAVVILDGQLGARANVIETRAVRWGSRRWNREFSSGTGGSSSQTRVSGNGQGVRLLKIETRAGKPKTSGIGCSDGVPDGLRAQTVESVILTVNRTS